MFFGRYLVLSGWAIVEDKGSARQRAEGAQSYQCCHVLMSDFAGQKVGLNIAILVWLSCKHYPNMCVDLETYKPNFNTGL